MRHVIQWRKGCGADAVGQIDRWPCLINAKTPPRQDILIDAGVEIGKPVGKLDLLIVNRNRAVCASNPRGRLIRKIAGVHGQEPFAPPGPVAVSPDVGRNVRTP